MSESQNSYTEARQSKSADGMIPCIEKNHPCSDRKPDERSSEGGAGRQGKGQLIKRHEGIQGYSTYCGGIFTGVYIYIYICHFHFSLSCIGEENGNPLQCSCLENPRDGGACWAAVYGVAQSRTRLK